MMQPVNTSLVNEYFCEITGILEGTPPPRQLRKLSICLRESVIPGTAYLPWVTEVVHQRRLTWLLI